MKYSDDSYDVLISYNNADKQEVEKIVQLLKDEGINPWFDGDIYPGESWSKHFIAATKVVKCVAAFFGIKGVGRWEDSELELIKKYCVEKRKFRSIPVLLPGVLEVPEEAIFCFAGIVPVRLRAEIKGSEDISQLIRAINDAIGKWEEKYPFEIEIDVLRAARSCFLAMPRQALDDIYGAVKQAIQEVNTSKVSAIQLIQIRKPNEDTFTEEDVVHIIREAELVVAVCTPQDATGSPCPEVMYELGMAHALGKSSILVTTDQSVEDQVRDRVKNIVPTVKIVKDALNKIKSGDLVVELKEAIKEVDAKIPKPFLLDPEVPEMHAFRSNLIRTVAIELPHFLRLVSFVQKTHREFRDLMQQSHALLTHMNELAYTVESERGQKQHSTAFVVQHKAFEKAYKDLLKKQEKWEERYYKELEDLCDDLMQAFDHLRDRLPEGLKKTLDDSQMWFNLVANEHIKNYLDSLEEIQRYATNNFECFNGLRPTANLRDEVEQLDKYLGLVNSDTDNMMNKLMEIFVEG